MSHKVIVETEHIKVIIDTSSNANKTNPYFVYNKGILRHPNCDAEDVMRALAHYLISAENEINKNKKQV